MSNRSINTYLKNVSVISGSVGVVSTNSPAQYTSRQKQYFDSETRYFTQESARFASDFLDAQVQGLDPEDPTAWGAYRLRFADVVRASSSIQRHFDDYKQYLFESRKIDYVRPGTKIVTMGNTWLVTNPNNISGASGTGLCRRCNAVWNHLDYYGNLISEPMIVENERANASDSDAQQSQLITKGYFNVLLQYNDDTRQIDTNTRFILGSAAYRVTGYSDFESEFTGDYDAVRLLSFSVRYEEPNDTIDDMVNHVAGGKTFTWTVSIAAVSSLRTGTTAVFTANSVRNDVAVTVTEDHPIHYLWESSDESIATVDCNGNVTAVSEGKAVITATLEQNPNYSASVTLNVSERSDGVGFTGGAPETLGAFEEATITAAYFEGGVETDEKLTFALSGAADGSYSAITGPKAVTVYCYGYSATPLTVTASYGGESASVEIGLEGI